MKKLLFPPDATQDLRRGLLVALYPQIITMKKLFYLAVTTLLFSCQPTKITQSWAAKDATPKKYKKILVLGVLSDNDIELQVKMEDHLAGDLKDLGYNAVAANKIFPPGTFVKGDTIRAKAAIEGKGFDGIMTVVLLDKKKETYYVPGRITDYMVYERYGRFNRYYNAVTERIYTPGYYGQETKYVWENNFYDLDSKQLIYSARSRSFDIVSKTAMAHSYGLLMVESLVQKNILVKPEMGNEE